MSEFEISVVFKFTYSGSIKFENKSKSKFDVMVHYQDEASRKKTLYLHYEGSKFARELSKKMIFEGEYMFVNQFTGNSFDVPLTAITIYPIENREYKNKTEKERNDWNSTVIKNLNDKFRKSIGNDYDINYQDYYYNLNQLEKKNKYIQIPKQTGNYWEDKKTFEKLKEEQKFEEEEDKEDEGKQENTYKGLDDIEKLKKLISKVEELNTLKKKLRTTGIKFEFKIESKLLNYTSENESD